MSAAGDGRYEESDTDKKVKIMGVEAPMTTGEE